tara:strand:- start:134 stop:799 length:666 start_codon:yes stop_codon:yes gene_type:complete
VPSGIYTLAIATDGWTGSATVTDGSITQPITPADLSSPYRVAGALAAASAAAGLPLDWSVTSAGLIKFESSSSVALSFTGNCGTRLGFASSGYGSATSHTAESASHGSLTPYADADGIFWSLVDVPIPSGKGTRLSGGAMWHRSPSTDHRRPTLRVALQRADALRFRTAWSLLTAPAELDVLDTSTTTIDPLYVTHAVGRLQSREASKLSGRTEITIEVLR